MSVTAFIGVGSNLGDRQQTIQQAKEKISAVNDIRFLRSASLYETKPMGGPAQGLFLNTVWELETDLSAKELLSVISKLESDLGRIRSEKNAPRTLDLDLLFYGDEIIQEPNLTVPHPRLQERWFVLKPLWDLRSDWVHPVLKKSVCELLDQVKQ